MRLPVALVACALIAGCSTTAGQHGQPGVAISPPALSATAPSAAHPTSSAQPAPTKAAPARAPQPGAPIAEVISWIEAGTPADPAGFHSATRDGTTTDLGVDIAFITASGTNCMTAKAFDGALACLVHPANPLPRPVDAYGNWVAGWVDFDGPTVKIGSAHGDPGRFIHGKGPTLKDGQSLQFGDYRCRADVSGLYCVDNAQRSAVRLSNDGVEPFGCLAKVNPTSDGVGQKFACAAA